VKFNCQTNYLCFDVTKADAVVIFVKDVCWDFAAMIFSNMDGSVLMI